MKIENRNGDKNAINPKCMEGMQIATTIDRSDKYHTMTAESQQCLRIFAVFHFVSVLRLSKMHIKNQPA